MPDVAIPKGFRSAILATSDEGAVTPNGVTGGEKMVQISEILVI